VLLSSLCAVLLVSLGAKAVEVRVSISNLKFKPPVVQIEPGDTVTWVNEDDADHTVTADDKSFKSGNLAAGKSFSQKFDKAGEFSYHCDYHPRMKGKVVVGGAKKK
jgi:plastocyanin